MTKIIIEAVAPGKMRLEAYREEGCGDWFVDQANGDIHIQVAFPTDIVDDDDAFLIALHELIEFKLCHKAGVTQGAVDVFDQQFTGEGEPGDAEDAPYKRQHRAACMLEHQMAIFLGRWDYGEVR